MTDLLQGHGDVQDGALLFSAQPGAPMISDYWLTTKTATAGWWPRRDPNDLATSHGGRGGPENPSLTYLTLEGVAVETPEALTALETTMRHSRVERAVAWFDQAHDEKVQAFVEPRGVTPRIGGGVQFYGHRLVDLSWMHTGTRVYGIVETPTVIDGTNLTVPNAGAVDTHLRVVVEGPCTHPRFRQMTTGKAFRFDDLTLTADQTLTVDLRAQTAIVSEDGEDDVSVWARATRDGGRVAMLTPMLIPPGGCPVGFASEAGNDEATAYTRPAW